MVEKKCADHKGEDKRNSLPEKEMESKSPEILQKRLNN